MKGVAWAASKSHRQPRPPRDAGKEEEVERADKAGIRRTGSVIDTAIKTTAEAKLPRLSSASCGMSAGAAGDENGGRSRINRGDGQR